MLLLQPLHHRKDNSIHSTDVIRILELPSYDVKTTFIGRCYDIKMVKQCCGSTVI